MIDGHARAYRCVGESYSNTSVIQHGHIGGGSVMVLDGITALGWIPMVVVDGSLIRIRYGDEIIPQRVMQSIRNSQRYVISQQDNARSHTARVESNYLRQQTVNELQ